jgi:Fic family protein
MTDESVQHGVKAAGKRVPTRAVQLKKMLQRKSGATIAQIQAAFGWQAHTARAAISAQRKAGCIVVRTDGKTGAIYRIAKAETGQ